MVPGRAGRGDEGGQAAALGPDAPQDLLEPRGR